MNSPSVPATSTETLGRYEILEELGRGAMGLVLLGRDPVLGRNVALKFVRPDLKLEAEDRALLMRRMRQEAQAIARVSHQGIVALHDIGEDESRGTYLVFQRATGPTLEAVLERGTLTRQGAARLAREMGDALTAAHESDVVHRDIKPANIILTEEGSKIADFGVARLPDSTLTRAGARIGTPAYSAPEAIKDSQYSAKSDQFSMAACLYESLSGRRPYPGKDAMQVALAIDRGPPDPMAQELGLSPKVDEVLLRGMAKNPERRFTTCKELGLALSDALVGVREQQPTLPDHGVLLRRRSEDRTRAVGSIVLWLLIGATLSAAVLRIAAARHEKAAKTPSATAAPSELPPLRDAYLSPDSVKDE